jgi:hypothetical protein
MKIKTIEWWNKIKKDNETQVIAAEGDNVLLINGVAFLIQRKNNWNNVVCIRLKPSKINIVQTFETFRAFCQKNDIQYFRVEGISHTYRMLELVKRIGIKKGIDCNVVYAPQESAEYDRHIYYVKAY